jgi:NAD(P)-dependent dehydrogenase (short-subunit alcohol dehydrogenase family)
MAALTRAAPLALVTGANRGIGLAIVGGLAERGFTVLLGGRDAGRAQRAAEPLQAAGLSVAPVQLDVTDQASVDVALQRIAAEHGRLDALVNNAGAFYDDDERPSDANLGVVRAALETNLIGPWRLCVAGLPLMRRHGYGRIVNVSSSSGAFSEPGFEAPAYSVSKAALNLLTLRLAAELAGSGILVNACCPGWVRTEMGGPNAPLSPEQGADTTIWLATLPAGGPTGGFFRERRRIPW